MSLACPICCAPYDDTLFAPRVIPKCGHTICTTCILNMLSSKPHIFKCPFDNTSVITSALERDFLTNFPKNYALLEIKAPSTNREVCPIHGKELELICMNEKTRICYKCALSRDHKDHTLIEEKEYNEDLQRAQKFLESYLSDLKNIENTYLFGHMELLRTQRDSLLEYLHQQVQMLVTCLLYREKTLRALIIGKFDEEHRRIYNELASSEKWKSAKKGIDELGDRIRAVMDGALAEPKNLRLGIDMINLERNLSALDTWSADDKLINYGMIPKITLKGLDNLVEIVQRELLGINLEVSYPEVPNNKPEEANSYSLPEEFEKTVSELGGHIEKTLAQSSCTSPINRQNVEASPKEENIEELTDDKDAEITLFFERRKTAKNPNPKHNRFSMTFQGNPTIAEIKSRISREFFSNRKIHLYFNSKELCDPNSRVLDHGITSASIIEYSALLNIRIV